MPCNLRQQRPRDALDAERERRMLKRAFVSERLQMRDEGGRFFGRQIAQQLVDFRAGVA